VDVGNRGRRFGTRGGGFLRGLERKCAAQASSAPGEASPIPKMRRRRIVSSDRHYVCARDDAEKRRDDLLKDLPPGFAEIFRGFDSNGRSTERR